MDVDQLKQLLQQYFLTPLNSLPIAQIKALDTNHDQSVQYFQDALNLLFGAGAKPFQGQAADAIADYVSSYLDAEEALSPYGGGGLSDRINTLLNKCAGVLEQEEPLMKAVQSNGAWATATGFVGQQEQRVDGSIPPDPEDPFWDLIQIFLIIGGVGVFVWASADQSSKVQDLTACMNMWVNDMQTLAQQPDPPGSQLPDLPSQIAQAVTVDMSIINSLTPQQQNQVRDIIQWLTANGVNGIDQSDIENLVKLGYDRNTIIQILLAGIPTTLSKPEIDAQLADLQARIDESKSKFTPAEKHLAYLLSSEGHTVVAIPSSNAGRSGDALVDGVPTEFKTLGYPATSDTVRNAVQRSLKRGGQARSIIIDARGSGLTEAEAERAFARLKNLTRGRVDSIRIIGDGFDITSTDFN